MCKNDIDFLISISLESDVIITDTNITNSSTDILRLSSSLLRIDGLIVQNINGNEHLLGLISCYDIVIKNSFISSASFPASNLTIQLTDSSILEISNVTVTDLPQIFMVVEQSNVTLIDSLNLSNLPKGIEFIETSVTSFSNSELKNLGSANNLKGGAILIQRSSIAISDSTFTNNKAYSGGAIKIE